MSAAGAPSIKSHRTFWMSFAGTVMAIMLAFMPAGTSQAVSYSLSGTTHYSATTPIIHGTARYKPTSSTATVFTIGLYPAGCTTSFALALAGSSGARISTWAGWTTVNKTGSRTVTTTSGGLLSGGTNYYVMSISDGYVAVCGLPGAGSSQSFTASLSM